MTDWRDRAACAGLDTEMFFDQTAAERALAVCRVCPVRAECLANELRFAIPHGIAGGQTATQRRTA